MDGLIPLLALNLALVTAVMVAVWIVSLRLRDVSIVDIAWGADGALISVLSFLLTDGPLARRALITGMTVFWGLRLALHIGLRKRGHGEDYRYAAMRDEHGDAFPLRSLFTVFLFQALLIWAITVPVQVTQTAAGPEGLTVLDFLGLGIWILGIALEGIADNQLQAFRSNPENRGKVMDRGLWRYSRHPNYFGESLVWWGIFLVAAATPGGWVTLFSPLLMTFFLLKVSGVPLLEEALAERRAGYREYMERTSIFIPWPPRRTGPGGGPR
jgi:steroid 5-alpha reductase family enzyme